MTPDLLLLVLEKAAVPGEAAAGAFETVYLICALVGLLFTVISFFMSGVFDAGDVGDHDFDLGHDVDVGHDIDVGHDVDTGGADAHADAGLDGHTGDVAALSPISPTTISMFITSFGAVGYLALVYMQLRDWYVHLPLAMGAGFAMAALIFWVLYKIFQVTVSSSEATVAALPGTAAEVIVGIPRNGLGEIAYTARGTRYNAAARSRDGRAIQQFTSVVIAKVVGGTCVVDVETPSPDASARRGEDTG
jgi:hypothetical protein